MSALVVHVGLHKTGTTTVQCSLDAAREELSRKKVCVFRGRNHGEFYRAFTDRPESFHRYYRSWGEDARQEEVREGIRNELTEREDVTHIVCSEDVSLLSTSALEHMKQFLSEECGVSRIRIVCMLRKPAEYLNSILQQYEKPGLVSLNDLCSGYFPGFAYHGVSSDEDWDYNGILEHLYFAVPGKLVRVFGGGAVHFLDFDSSKERGLVQSVLSAGGLNELSIGETRMNDSMSHEACILLGEYNNRYPLFSEHKGYNPEREKSSPYIRFLRSLPGERPSLLDPRKIDSQWIQNRIREIHAIMERNVLDPEEDSMPLRERRDLLRMSERTVEYLNNFFGYKKSKGLKAGLLTREEIEELGRRFERDYSLPRRIRMAFQARSGVWRLSAVTRIQRWI